MSEPIKPATDSEITEYLRLHEKADGGHWNCDLDANVTVRQLIARIESLKADLAETKQILESTTRVKDEEIARLRSDGIVAADAS